MKKTLCVLLGVAAMMSVGCAEKPTDYRAYVRHMPKSVVVLPPVNHSANARASDAFLSTVTAPLAECGYYVFPIVIVDQMLKDNGVPTPGDMRQVQPQKFNDVFGADAVMYIDIKTWTTTYIVIDSSTVVNLEYRLVDTKTGTDLWRREQAVRYSSSAGSGGNPISMVVSAAVHAALSNALQYEKDLARQANVLVFTDRKHGLLKGHRHPGYAKDQVRATKNGGATTRPTAAATG